MPRKPMTGNLENVRLAFGKAITGLRHKSKTAQEDLAYEADVDRGYMSGLERGLHSPTLDTVCKLLWKLNVSFVDFAVQFEIELKRLNRAKHGSPKNTEDSRKKD